MHTGKHYAHYRGNMHTQVMLRVSNLERSIAYYRDCLGMKLLRTRDNPGVCVCVLCVRFMNGLFFYVYVVCMLRMCVLWAFGLDL